MNDLRIIEKLDGGEWVRIQMQELREGDIFHMFDDEQDLERNAKVGDNDFVAMGDARLGINVGYPGARGVNAELYSDD